MVKMGFHSRYFLFLLVVLAVAPLWHGIVKPDALATIVGCLFFAAAAFLFGINIASGRTLLIGGNGSKFIAGHVYLTLTQVTGSMGPTFVIKDGASSDVLLVSLITPGDAPLPSCFTVDDKGDIINLGAPPIPILDATSDRELGSMP